MTDLDPLSPSVSPSAKTEEKDVSLPGTLGREEPDAMRLHEPPANAWIQCAICCQQNSFGCAHWAWHKFCRSELNPVAFVQWLNRLDYPLCASVRSADPRQVEPVRIGAFDYVENADGTVTRKDWRDE